MLSKRDELNPKLTYSPFYLSPLLFGQVGFCLRNDLVMQVVKSDVNDATPDCMLEKMRSSAQHLNSREFVSRENKEETSLTTRYLSRDHFEV